MEGQKKEKQITGYFIKGGIIAVFFSGGFFVKIVFYQVLVLALILASTTFNIILTNKTALSQDKAVFN